MQIPWSCKDKIPSFAAKLELLNLGEIPVSDYSKRYLGHLLSHQLYYLAIYASVLDNVISHYPKQIADLTLVDFGAGNGLLGMFAKHCGAGFVILCDRDPEFVNASRLAAAALDIKIDRYVTGDIADLVVAVEDLQIDAVAGTDVIEHIYDLDHFFSALKKMNVSMITVFTTASNPCNYFKVKQLERLHEKDELEGSDPADSVLAGAIPHEPYLQMREKIIRSNFPTMADDNAMLLAKLTRGLNEHDINVACSTYLKTGNLPVPGLKSTNTCDPITGSWTERVLPLSYFEKLYEKYGFRLQVTSGFYNNHVAGPKRVVNKILNLVIKLTGKNTAPFITLTGFKTT
jgi:hypothetical protein